jgi:hypothetical protein
MQRYTVIFYLQTALHVSGGTTTHIEGRKQLYLQHLVFVTPLLLSAAISWTRFECAGGAALPPMVRSAHNIQHLVFVTPLLLSADIVEELEPG